MHEVTTMGQISIHNDKVYLRSLEESDLDSCYKWHTDEKLYENLVNSYRHVSKQMERSWIETKCQYSSSEINLAICIKEINTHIGNIYLRDIDWISRRGHLGIFIGEVVNRSKGYGQSAVKLLLKYAYNDLGLNKIVLDVLAKNQQAIHVYEKIGFRIEGTFRQHVYKCGVWQDVIYMGLLAKEFVY
jgi:diamine N-acetyltransferase